MQSTTSLHTRPSHLTGALRTLAALGILALALALSVPIYAGWLSGSANRDFRYGFALLWGGLALVAARRERTRPFLPLLLSLFGVSLGLAFAYLAANSHLADLGGSWHTPRGAAANKILTEVVPVCAAILFAARLSRRSRESLGLGDGRPWQSLRLGLLTTLPLLGLFVIDPSGGRDAVLSTPVAVLGAWLPWIVLFSVTNGFMEELWYRGLWYGAFKPLLGTSAAIHVTSIAFCAMHVMIYWGDVAAVVMLTPAWLFMGYAYALIMRKTGSLWGPVLAHAIADMLFLFVAFGTGRM